MLEFICQLISPLITVINNRRNRQKQRWEKLLSPIFRELADIDRLYEVAISKAILRTMVICNVLERNEKERLTSLRQSRISQSAKQLQRIRQQMRDNLLSLGNIESKKMMYQILQKKGRLSGDERTYLDAILGYLSMISPDIPLSNKGSTKLKHIPDICSDDSCAKKMLHELQGTREQRMKLFRMVCESYSQLQLAVLD